MQTVENLPEKSAALSFKPNGFLAKLIWREHQYQPWLQAYLTQFDLHCVENVDDLNRLPYSITQEGLIQRQAGYFEKKDQSFINDRHQWQLGFNNKARLALLEQDFQTLVNQESQLTDVCHQFETQEQQYREQLKYIEQLKQLNWEEINALYWQELIQKTQENLTALEQGDIKFAEQRWQESEVALEKCRQQHTEIAQNIAVLQEQTKQLTQTLNTLQPLLNTPISPEIQQALDQRIGNIDKPNTEQEKQLHQELETQLSQLSNKISHAKQQISRAIGEFKGNPKWQPLTVTWGVDLDGVNDYLRHLDHLQQDGLPNLVEKFKQRLNKHSTQSLALLQSQFENEIDTIKERIGRINRVLQRTEFQADSYLRLKIQTEYYPHVKTFRQNVGKVLQQITSDNHEMRFAMLQDVVNTLEKACRSDSLESTRLLDPRYQMSFYAEELNRDDHKLKDVLNSSSSKSGGEKEAFAGVILAASLAYVLTPEQGDEPVFCTVFLDEAFSNTSETVSRRVLKVFKALQIHINLITPWKNLNLAQESMRSLIYTQKMEGKHQSYLTEITWQQAQKMIAKKGDNK